MNSVVNFISVLSQMIFQINQEVDKCSLFTVWWPHLFRLYSLIQGWMSLSSFVLTYPNLSSFILTYLHLSYFILLCPPLSYFVLLYPTLSYFILISPHLPSFTLIYPHLPPFTLLFCPLIFSEKFLAIPQPLTHNPRNFVIMYIFILRIL